MKKKISINFLVVAILITIDECIKKYIYFIRQGLTETCSGGIIHIHPVFNEYGTTMNMLSQTSHSKMGFVVWNLILLGVAVWLWNYSYRTLIAYKKSLVWLLPIDFLAAVGLGRIVERFCWEYTLDYIAIRNYGIWDTLDLYAMCGSLGCIVLFFALDRWKAQDKESIA